MKRNKITLLKEEIKILQDRIRNYKNEVLEHRSQAKRYSRALISLQKRLGKLKIRLKSLIEKDK